jgi:hypothetical protein
LIDKQLSINNDTEPISRKIFFILVKPSCLLHVESSALGSLLTHENKGVDLKGFKILTKIFLIDREISLIILQNKLRSRRSL